MKTDDIKIEDKPLRAYPSTKPVEKLAFMTDNPEQKLLRCPFCGKPPTIFSKVRDTLFFSCETKNCLSGHFGVVSDINKWNTRSVQNPEKMNIGSGVCSNDELVKRIDKELPNFHPKWHISTINLLNDCKAALSQPAPVVGGDLIEKVAEAIRACELTSIDTKKMSMLEAYKASSIKMAKAAIAALQSPIDKPEFNEANWLEEKYALNKLSAEIDKPKQGGEGK